MRKNVLQVFSAWKLGQSLAFNSISTNGKTIFSYKTPIVHMGKNGPVVNRAKYSPTTTKQQNQLLELLAK